MSVKELRDELRALRKEAGARPISKMKKGDISSEIERLKAGRETTAAVAATPSGPKKMAKAAAESIKEAKRSEFPVMPSDVKKKSAPSGASVKKSSAPAEDKKKGSKLHKLMAMLDTLSDSDEE
jgi:hypothetical protein